MGEERTGRPGPTKQRVTVPEAAELLGITVEAVRMRIKRGTLRSERQAGRVFVLLGQGQPTEQPTDRPDEPSALISQMQGRIDSLERQLEEAAERDRENRRIIVALTSRIPAIEAPPDSPPGAPREPEDASPVTESHEGASPMGETPAVGVSAVRRPGMALLFAIGAGAAAGASNPVLLSRMDNVLWLAALLLWVFPPIFGLRLGQRVALRMEYFYTRAEDLRKQIDNSPPPQNSEQQNKQFALEDRYDSVMRASYKEGGRPALYAVLVALVTFFNSLGILWFWGYLLPPTIPLRTVLGVAIAQAIVAAMFVLFAAFVGIGRARQRREAERPSAGDGVSTEASAANRQALIGLVGTIVTAILAFVGVLVQVFSSGGGQGAGG